MVINESLLNSSAPDPSDSVLQRPPWVTTTLGCFLIFTIVVDILGNLLVIFSVYRNKKLRNAGERRACVRACACVIERKKEKGGERYIFIFKKNIYMYIIKAN